MLSLPAPPLYLKTPQPQSVPPIWRPLGPSHPGETASLALQILLSSPWRGPGLTPPRPALPYNKKKRFP